MNIDPDFLFDLRGFESVPLGAFEVERVYIPIAIKKNKFKKTISILIEITIYFPWKQWRIMASNVNSKINPAQAFQTPTIGELGEIIQKIPMGL